MVHLKSERELERLRASADLVGRTLGAVASSVAPGVSTSELDQIAEAFILDHNAKPAFKGYRVGKEVFPSTLCTSVNDEPHIPFGGSKASDLGRHGGRWSVETFTETRWITLDRGGRPYPPVF